MVVILEVAVLLVVVTPVVVPQKKCSTCRGTGACKACDGSGIYGLNKICGACKGTGNCQWCGGTGKR